MSSNNVFLYVFSLLLHCYNMSYFLTKPLQRLQFLLTGRIIYVASIFLSCTGSDAMIWKITVWFRCLKWASVQMLSREEETCWMSLVLQTLALGKLILVIIWAHKYLKFLFDKQLINNLKVDDTSGRGKQSLNNKEKAQKYYIKICEGITVSGGLTMWLLNDVQSQYYSCFLWMYTFTGWNAVHHIWNLLF